MSTTTRMMIVVGVIFAAAALLLVARRAGPPRTGLKVAFDAEFLTRPDGYKGLSEHYGFEFASEPMQMDPGLMYRALADGAVDVIDGFATDGRIPAYGLAVLEDDRGFFPPYYAAPLVRAETLDEHPQLGELLNRLGGRISNEAMQQMNYEVDEKGQKAEAVAREFLEGEGLIGPGATAGEGRAGTIILGGKHFSEQEILGELMALVIECNCDIKVVRKLNLGGTIICFNALTAGDLDLYAEYTGTALVNILKQGAIADPEEAYETVKREFSRKYDLVWLEPFGFNNTYTLTMRRQQAEALGIQTISDLAEYVTSEDAR